MEALLRTSASLDGLPLPRRRTAPSAAALYEPLAAPLHLHLRRRRRRPTRGLRCAGADWPEPSPVAVAEKFDAEAASAGKARASEGGGGEEEQFGEIDGVVDGSAVEDSVAVPSAPLEQSLVAVDSAGDDALSQAIGSKLDLEEASTYVIYGAGAFVTGWVLSAVVSAIESIPLLPMVLEIVGLSYTIWFSTRYLLYKENRDELLVKVEDLRRRIFGSGDV